MMWHNGELVENGTVAASSAGVTLGWGVFTTLGVRNGTPRFLSRHFKRLERDARTAEVPFQLDFGAIESGLAQVLRSNQIQNGLARLTLARRGDGRWNDDQGADFSILASEMPPLSPDLRVALSPYRVEARRALCGVKTTSYLDYLWAWRQIKARGFDEAILRDGNDFLCEAARATLFWMKNGALYTPSLSTGCLAGIGRELALEWAAAAQIEVREGEFTATQAQEADEIWLVAAAAGPRAVTSWHDEEGVTRALFARRGAGCAAFAEWFDSE